LLFPSISEEPFPNAVLESSLLAMISITPNIGGIKEILENTVGEKYMFDAGDVRSLLGILDEIVNHNPHDIIGNERNLRSRTSSKFEDKEFQVVNKMLKILS